MKEKYKRSLSILLVLALSLSCLDTFAEPEDTGSYNMEAAVRTGLANSLALQQLEDRIILSELKVDAYKDMGSDLISGDRDLDSGENNFNDAMILIMSNQDALNEAKLELLDGYYPQGFPEYTLGAREIKDMGLSAGPFIIIPDHDEDDSDRRTILQQIRQQLSAQNTQEWGGALTEDQISSIASEISKAFVKELKAIIKAKQKELDEGKVDFQESLLTLVDGKVDYAVAKANISGSIASQLGMSDLSKLSPKADKNLLMKMSEAAAAITVASRGIYRNQAALLIQNSYYNVLKAQKLMEVRQESVKRAEAQYGFARDGYENGMKTLDDMLYAQIYHTGTLLELQKAQDDYDNAMIELKKNMNIPLDKAITLDDVPINGKPVVDLAEGLELGLEGRLEIIKAAHQVGIYEDNLDYVKKYYSKRSEQYKEALRLQNTAELEQQKAKLEVESSIRQSYNTVLTMGSMLRTSEETVVQAQECLAVAKARYDAGLGTGSSLMNRLNLNASSGTILEVISAEENLAQVEETRVEIIYGYNLAKAKYLNDIAYLTY